MKKFRAARVVGAQAFEASGGVRPEAKVAFMASLGGVEVEAVHEAHAVLKCHRLAAEYIAGFGFEVRFLGKGRFEVPFAREGLVVLPEEVGQSLFAEA